MICLHCGHCCIFESTWIVDDPQLGYKKANLIYKMYGEECKHRKNNRCSVYNEPWFKETSCYKYGYEGVQDERCQIGVFILGGKK